VTIAVLLIRSGLNSGSTDTTTTTGSETVTRPTTTAATTHTTGKTTAGKAQYYTVQAGDTFGSISAKTGVSLAELEQLNPAVSSNTLQVGQRLRVK
jgi:LysM repeat protein